MSPRAAIVIAVIATVLSFGMGHDFIRKHKGELRKDRQDILQWFLFSLMAWPVTFVCSGIFFAIVSLGMQLGIRNENSNAVSVSGTVLKGPGLGYFVVIIGFVAVVGLGAVLIKTIERMLLKAWGKRRA